MQTITLIYYNIFTLVSVKKNMCNKSLHIYMMYNLHIFFIRVCAAVKHHSIVIIHHFPDGQAFFKDCEVRLK